jgi:hypothetical protein
MKKLIGFVLIVLVVLMASTAGGDRDPHIAQEVHEEAARAAAMKQAAAYHAAHRHLNGVCVIEEVVNK